MADYHLIVSQRFQAKVSFVLSICRNPMPRRSSNQNSKQKDGARQKSNIFERKAIKKKRNG